MIPCGILSSCKTTILRQVVKCEILQNTIFLKIPLAAFLFTNFVITMFPCGILSTYKVTQKKLF